MFCVFAFGCCVIPERLRCHSLNAFSEPKRFVLGFVDHSQRRSLILTRVLFTHLGVCKVSSSDGQHFCEYQQFSVASRANAKSLACEIRP